MVHIVVDPKRKTPYRDPGNLLDERIPNIQYRYVKYSNIEVSGHVNLKFLIQ